MIFVPSFGPEKSRDFSVFNCSCLQLIQYLNIIVTLC